MQNMSGTQNVFLGASAGNLNTSGQGNSFVGYQAGYSNVGGNNNTFFGSGAGFKNDAGFSNVFVGQRSGYFNAGGAYNAFVGTGAGYNNTSGANNSFIGSDAGSTNTTGSDNIFIGSLAGSANDVGSSNVFIGSKASLNNKAGKESVSVGFQAGYNSLGDANLFLGAYAGFSQQNATGYNNTFIGQRTGFNNSSGFANIFLGSNAGYSNQSGNYNTFIGNSAGQQSQFGSFNTFIGNGAGYNAGNANYNLMMGAQAGFYTTSGSYNVILGQDAGINNRGGNNNTFVGKGAGGDQNSPNLENSTAIGANAVVSANNALVLGSNVNVGIGTSAPARKLEVVSGTAGSSGLRLTNLTTANPGTIATATRFLTVNAQGDVVLGSTTGARMGADEANWTAEGSNLINANAGAVIIGSGIAKTPAGYRLFVKEGILTEKVKVAVANTNEWSDKVFEAGYNLRSLNQVEAHIKQHGHLPGVPSATEVVKEGIDVGKMDAKLLEKIEELTLYVIELKKETQALKVENARIKQQLRRPTRR
ncbi:hypothetical protein FAES_4972 [Fibrella aestuarina BUZ 2]|uniref:TMF family protein n=1 Tax=Fibrella aestuarina BUZ 2 TaxID=1166018 RepID=I0KFR8_9BACT|nr:hypothetical protein FAES_4972 [Fibrella aestuarina BUZ 2]